MLCISECNYENTQPKFRVGDKVSLALAELIFEKGYKPQSFSDTEIKHFGYLPNIFWEGNKMTEFSMGKNYQKVNNQFSIISGAGKWTYNLPYSKGVSRQRWRGFGALARTVDRTTLPILKNVLTEAKKN